MTRFRCPKCSRRYDDAGATPLAGPPLCTGGGRHNRITMVEMDEYQATLDRLGIPDNDPLREAT